MQAMAKPRVTAIILNWCEIHVVAQSIPLLLAEQDVEVIVVDNGSHDGSQDYLRFIAARTHEHGKRLKTILLSENTGPSVARNVAIEMAQGEDIFLIDGDILYVPGTIDLYAKLLQQCSSAACVGYNDFQRVQTTGLNGTRDPGQANKRVADSFEVHDWFPMAWTQYGLFRGEVLRRIRFVTEGVFGEPGHGYEDDWLYHELVSRGWKSLAVTTPLYYHDGHYGLRMLESLSIPNKGAERAEAFYGQWGKNSGWRESLQEILQTTQRPLAVCKNGVFDITIPE